MHWYREYYVIGRNSNVSTFLMHLPYLSYLFWLFQGRGAYRAIQHFFFHNKKLPSFFRTIYIAIKYALFGWLTSGVFFLIGLSLNFNYFGEAAAYFLRKLSLSVGQYFSEETSTYLFQNIPLSLESNLFQWNIIQDNLIILLGSYVIFSLLGSILSLLHAKSDIKRSLEAV